MGSTPIGGTRRLSMTTIEQYEVLVRRLNNRVNELQNLVDTLGRPEDRHKLLWAQEELYDAERELQILIQND